jgi:hypothetical protein
MRRRLTRLRRRLTRLRHRLFGHPPDLVHMGVIISGCDCDMWDTE